VEAKVRAGGLALSWLAIPLNVHIFQALADGPQPLFDLRRAAGSPPETTLRAHLRELTANGLLERRRQNSFPGSIDYRLKGPGRDLLAVLDVLEVWLAAAPGEPLEAGGVAAKGAIKALVEAWSTSLLRALAARPFSLTELNRLVTSISYPALERRLTAMRLAGQLEVRPGAGRGRPYAVTRWLRQAIGPLCAAASFERHHPVPGATPIARIDAEAGFLLALPLVRLSAELAGSCRLAVDLAGDNGPRPAGVLVGVEHGRVVSCVAKLAGDASSWAAGPTSAWLAAVVDRALDRLELGGDERLAAALVDGLHAALIHPVAAGS
jgi:DNA-binding HxlR family transcriptional regulator